MEITDQKDLLTEIKRFYFNLFKSRDDYLEDVDLNIRLQDYEVPKLSEDIKEDLECEITMEEVSLALKGLYNDKSPGPDGFPAEFLNFFLERH